MRRVAALLGCLGLGACSSSGPTAPPVPTQVVFTVQPSGTPGGQTFSPAIQVAIQDASGNTVTTATNSVTLAIGSNQSGGTLSGTTTVSAVNGVATFSTLSIGKAGSGYTLSASAAGLTGATSASFAITIGPPARLAFAVQPTNTVAGKAVTPAIQIAIEDAGGNAVSTATNSVTITVGTNPGGGTLSGTVTANAVSGVATFSTLSLNKTGSGYTLAATAGTLTAATSSGFAISPGPATQLVFTGQPTTVVAGRAITPPVQVTAWDADGNIATGFAGSVTVAIGTNPGGGALSGTLTETAAAGVVSFADLAVSDTGTGYTLAASAGALAATSTAFIVGETGIDYHGGPIIITPKIAALYWSPSIIYSGGPSPGTSGAPATADLSLISSFLLTLGGSPYFNILTTYYDATNTYVHNGLTYTQYWADSTAPPAAPSDSAIAAEIERGFARGTFSYDANTLYAVFTGSGVNLGGGFGTTYCAYHSYFIDSQGRNVKYAAMPYDNDYLITQSAAGCSLVGFAGSPNNDGPADAEVNTLSHELAETVTDQNGNAWWVSSGPHAGYENGDLCNFTFGSYYFAPNGAAVNQSIGGKDFLVQMLWVNMETAQGAPVGCQQNWAPSTAGLRRGSRPPGGLTPPRGAVAGERHILRMFKAGHGSLVAASTGTRRPG